MTQPDIIRLNSFPPAVRLRLAAGLVEQGQYVAALELVSTVREDLAMVVHIREGREAPAAQKDPDPPSPK